MKLFLAISEPKNVVPLFTSRNGTPLSIFQLSKLICRLVLKGDPVTKFKDHDIRKFAASLSLILLMDVKDLLSAMHWKSSSDFFRHYLTITHIPQRTDKTDSKIPSSALSKQIPYPIILPQPYKPCLTPFTSMPSVWCGRARYYSPL